MADDEDLDPDVEALVNELLIAADRESRPDWKERLLDLISNQTPVD